ncbi:hypothetical protein MRB53_030209 [Persea americana]|uniref:Uncharacterized protein n=1 Tax=Persea americana TaxID=3435 RepID=A0ACC2KKK1_PERAE|nr:hypothetical protein MRB53_030209 [Persea americana]
MASLKPLSSHKKIDRSHSEVKTKPKSSILGQLRTVSAPTTEKALSGRIPFTYCFAKKPAFGFENIIDLALVA